VNGNYTVTGYKVQVAGVLILKRLMKSGKPETWNLKPET
jgi:hypothetical protein